MELPSNGWVRPRICSQLVGELFRVEEALQAQLSHCSRRHDFVGGSESNWQQASCRSRSNQQLEAVKPLHDAVLCRGSRYDSHSARAPDRRANLSVQTEAAVAGDRICANPVQESGRFRQIEGQGFLPADTRATRQAEQVIHTARPGETAVAQIAFPAAGVTEPKLANGCLITNIDNSAAEDSAELEPLPLLPYRPNVPQCERRDGHVL